MSGVVTFLRERFPLAVHGPAIVLYLVANAALARVSIGARVHFEPRDLAVLVVVALMFLRLRLFDEVKDYEHDKVHNPTRPLPRGVLSVRAVNGWAVGNAIVEGAISVWLGRAALYAWAILTVFTLLMRAEFFVREWIRPRLLTYALAHTPSGGLIGLYIFSATTGIEPWHATRAMWIYVAAGWALLMVFEVARKTMDPASEPGVDTYSSVFGARGAALLNLLFLCLSSGLISWAVSEALRAPARALVAGFAAMTALAGLTVLRYGATPSPSSARLLRVAAQAYLVLASVVPAAYLVACAW